MSSKIKVLYVEDEPNLAKIVVDSLQVKNIDVLHIAHGLEVIKSFNSFLPDVCVLDVMLPGKDGFTLGKEIRTISPHTPIIYLTAKNKTQDVLDGFNHGGNDYMRKPFSVDELIARIHNLNQIHSQKTVEADWSIGLYILHPLKQLLEIREEYISLTHRENEILKMLISRKFQNVSRQEILKQLWGDDSYFNSRNLDVYISKLRGHLKRDPAVQLLTLKGVGYRLIDSAASAK